MAKSAGGNPGKGDVFSLERLEELIAFMKEHELFEIDLKQGDQAVRLSRSGSGAQFVPAPVAAAPSAPAPSAPSAPAASMAIDEAHIKTICSPMVGTFYIKPNPTSPEFVKVGSRVSSDTVVCIVEAMKVFNEIPAEISGTIVEVLVKNEEAVDFNRPLFKVDTRG